MAVRPTHDQISQKGMIITDDVTYHPVLDFDLYSDTVVYIIANSYPKFSLGIYGEWGTGKTTLMKSVENKLKQAHDDMVLYMSWE
jgi:ABC-type phosphonate transport system ATPase subunit